MTNEVAWVENATKNIQDAIKLRHRVVLPFVGKPWRTDPLWLRDGTILELRPGVRLEARRGGFEGPGDCLLRVHGVMNVDIIGSSATLAGWAMEQTNPTEYGHSQWRHGLSVCSSNRVKVKGLRIENFGGDGVYVGRRTDGKPCWGVTVESIVCDGNYRNGLSITSGIDIQVLNSEFSRTRGNNPQAGVDVEPNSADDTLEGILLHGCRAFGNNGHGFAVWLNNLNKTSPRSLIVFRDCHSVGNRKQPDPLVSAPSGLGAGSTIRFENSTFENSERPKQSIAQFKGCTWARQTWQVVGDEK